MKSREPAQPAKRKILVVDDHPIVREGMSLLINREADLEVCGDAENAREAMAAIERLRPHLVILDLSLDGPDGLEVLKMIRAREPGMPVLILSMHDENTYAERALRAGANGYIMKQKATDKVLTAIRRILAGEIYVSEHVASLVLHRMAGGERPEASPMSKLSDRELEVFRLIGEGNGTRQIAEALNLSVKTVETYEAHLKEKLSLGSVRELMRYAVEWALTHER
jgi:DNA-binding NarL/FixJ family response regulator